MRFCFVFLAGALLAACSPPAPGRNADPAPRSAGGFPLPDRDVAGIVAPEWSSGPDRDAADESGQLIRGLQIGPGMKVADIGAGSGYHTLRLSPAVGPTGTVYAEDIVEAYISGLRREAERRGLKNVRIVVGTPDDPKLPAKAIDRAVLVHMYHEVENPYALLWNLAGSLKPERPGRRHRPRPRLGRPRHVARPAEVRVRGRGLPAALVRAHGRRRRLPRHLRGPGETSPAA